MSIVVSLIGCKRGGASPVGALEEKKEKKERLFKNDFSELPSFSYKATFGYIDADLLKCLAHIKPVKLTLPLLY